MGNAMPTGEVCRALILRFEEECNGIREFHTASSLQFTHTGQVKALGTARVAKSSTFGKTGERRGAKREETY